MEAAPHPWPALGVLLMRDGIVSKEDLEAILSEQHDTRLQRISGRRLGEILIDRGIATPTQIAKVIAEQYELPFVDFDVADIDLQAARLLSEADARRLSALPISKRADGSFLLAIADPSTVVFSDELRRLLGATPHFAVVGPSALDEAIAYVQEHAPEPTIPASDEQPLLSADGLVIEIRPQTTDSEHRTHQRSATHHWPPLGALLIREGLLSDAELEAALAQQRLSASRRLGEILVERGAVSRSEIARLLAEQYELPFVDLSQTDVDPAVALLLPEDLARSHTAVPIARHEDGSLEVAIADPTNLLATDDLHRALEAPLSFSVASPEAIESVVAAAHSSAPVFEQPQSEQAPAAPEPEPMDEPVAYDVFAPELAFEATDERPLAHDEPVPRPQAVGEGAETAADETTPTWARALDLDEDTASGEHEDPDVSETDLATTLLAEVTEAEDVADSSKPPAGLVLVPELNEPDVLEQREQPEPEEAASFADESDTPFARWLPVEEEELDLETGESSDELAADDEGDEVVGVRDEAEPEEVAAPEGFAEPEVIMEPEEVAEPDEAVEPGSAWLDEVEWLETAPESDTPELEVPAAQPQLASEPVRPTADHDAEQGDLAAALESALAAGATAIHFSPQADGVRVRARVDGLLRELGTVSPEEAESLLSGLESSARVRTHLTPTKRGDKVTVFTHELRSSPATLAELGLADDVRETLQAALESSSGIVLATGPAGSGTTTTLYAVLDSLAAEDRVVTTIEDPVERLLDGVDQTEVDEARGSTYASGLRSLRHSDSDVFLVGELADRETVDLAFRFALSGRVVLSTLHASSAARALRRLLDLGLDGSVLADCVTCVVAQRLVRRICTACRETYYASEAELTELGLPVEGAGPRLLARGRGCEACGGTGFLGQAGIFEVLETTEEVRELLREGASTKEIHRAAVVAGMRTLGDDGVRLCLEGITTTAEVSRVLHPGR